ncbi:MAG: GNAT family N-acetyltransferase [Egibacteraceae bacterium]
MSTYDSCSAGEGVAFHHLHQDFDESLLACFYNEVLAPAFNADELGTFEWFARGLRDDGEVLASVALGREGEVLGGLVATRHRGSGVLLLSYLVVRVEVRRRGIGTLLLREVAPQWYADPTVLLALGEVHDPRYWSGVPGEDPVARLRLYGRLGARVLATPFIQPALKPESNRVRGFLLLVAHVAPEACVVRAGQTRIHANLIHSFVRHYYEAAEGIIDPEDAELSWLLRYIEGQSEIPLLPVHDYQCVPVSLEP